MQNDFEKQVKEKLDGLRLAPSAPVWLAVEAEIREKKDRRRLLLWLVLALLLTSAGFYWHYAGKNVDKLSVSLPLSSSSKNKQTTQETKENKVTEKQGTASHQTDLRNTTPTWIATQGRRSGDKKGEKRVPSMATTLQNSKEKQKDPGTSTPSAAPGEENGTGYDKKVFEKVADEGSLVSQNRPKSIKVLLLPFLLQLPKPDFSLQHAKERSLVIATEPQVVHLNNGRLKWGVQFGYGTSGVRSGGGLLPNLSGDKSLNSAGASSSPSNYGGGGSQSGFSASPIKDGHYIHAGILLQIDLGKKWTLSPGITYQFVRASMTIGHRTADTLINSVPTAVYLQSVPGTSVSQSSHTYFIRYQYIGLPVLLGFRPLDHLPLSIHGGLAFQYLVNSNALQYNNSSLVVYYDKSAFRRGEWSAIIGADYRFLQAHQYSFIAGPDLIIGSAIEKSRYDQRHFVQMGLSLKILSSKK